MLCPTSVISTRIYCNCHCCFVVSKKVRIVNFSISIGIRDPRKLFFLLWDLYDKTIFANLAHQTATSLSGDGQSLELLILKHGHDQTLITLLYFLFLQIYINSNWHGCYCFVVSKSACIVNCSIPVGIRRPLKIVFPIIMRPIWWNHSCKLSTPGLFKASLA